jgi:hypothetical protein
MYSKKRAAGLKVLLHSPSLARLILGAAAEVIEVEKDERSFGSYCSARVPKGQG